MAPRAALADWLTAPDNRFFARAVANRIWAYFFGLPLAGPAEEEDAEQLTEHADLLGELARQLILHKYDLKYLLRAVVASGVYQRASTATHPGQDDPRLFARMAVRGLTVEQLFDSLAEATGHQPTLSDPMNVRRRAFAGEAANTPRGEFLARFTSPERPAEAVTSILQALFLMNGKFMADATSPEQNRVLATVASSRSDTGRKIDELYLVTLGRRSRPAERARLVAYVEKGDDTAQALADVFWALLNSAEFMLNH